MVVEKPWVTTIVCFGTRSTASGAILIREGSGRSGQDSSNKDRTVEYACSCRSETVLCPQISHCIASPDEAVRWRAGRQLRFTLIVDEMLGVASP